MALGKKLRNRIVGALVLVSLDMILVPAIMDPGQIYKRSSQSIAVNGNGVVTDSSGRLVEGGGQDYSDLLAPIEGNGITPEQLAAQNSGSENTSVQDSTFNDTPSASLPLPAAPEAGDPFAAANSSPQSLNVAPAKQVERLKEAQTKQEAPKALAVATPKNSGTEVLRSNRSKPATSASSNNNSERLVSTKRNNTTSSAPKSQNSGSYSVQVGVFSSKANADAVVSKLRQAGISARQVPAVINGRNLIRVYAGSAASREAADGIARRVQQVTGTKGAVVNLGK